MAIIASNKKAYHTYEILDILEAGLVLTGAEIKAIRDRKLSLAGSYARLLLSNERHELFWVGGTISIPEGDPLRTRKLLVHKQELGRLIGKLQEKGLTLIPLKLYLKRGKAKLELGLGRGKQLYDKRETIKRRDLLRRLEAARKNSTMEARRS